LSPGVQLTNDDNIMYLCCSDSSDNEKPKANDYSSSVVNIDEHAIGVDTVSSLLLGNENRTPMVTATVEAATKVASPDVAMAFPATATADVDDVYGDAHTDSVTDTTRVLNDAGEATRTTRTTTTGR
jgi:hypothetical protein